MNTFQTVNKPLVIIFANPGGFAVSLIEELLNNLCRIVVVTNYVDEWRKKTEQLNFTDVQFVTKEFVNPADFVSSYLIFISDSVEPSENFSNNDESMFELLNEFLYKQAISVLFIFPRVLYPDLDKKILEKAEDLTVKKGDIASIFLVGELLGSRVSLNNKRPIAQIINSVAKRTPADFPQNIFIHYLSPVSETVRIIVKKLFSFGVAGQRLAIHSEGVSSETILETVRNLLNGFVVTKKHQYFVAPSYENVSGHEIIEMDFAGTLQSIFNWFNTGLTIEPLPTENFPDTKIANHHIKKDVLNKKKPFEKIVEPFRKLLIVKNFWHRKKFLLPLVLITCFVILPYVLLLVGGSSIVFAKKEINAGRLERAGQINSIAKLNFKLAKTEFDILEKLPVAGKLFSGASDAADISLNLTLLSEKVLAIAQKATSLSKSVLADGKNVSKYSGDIYLDLESIYRQISFLEPDLESMEGVSGYILHKVFDGFNFDEMRNKIYNFSLIAKDLPKLLGVEGKQTYLLLLQNNMELRPTGGFIGSFALITFENGVLVNIDVRDVYDADGQLKGHVEPPKPIKDHLGEANWFLRDSNWDPDFPASATQAQWFLDKEIDVKVDGVIGIDLEVAKELVRIFGPLDLRDFGKVLTSDNFYEVTQTEVEKDFFPGSRKKSGFLTAVVRDISQKLTHSDEKVYPEVAKITLSALEKRHIQIYLHSSNSKKGINGLGWDGAFVIPSCLDNCFSDYLGLSEANVGVNKANYFLKRSMSLDVDVGGLGISRTLQLNLENNQNDLGKVANYKAYIRLITAKDTQLQEMKFLKGGVYTEINPDISQIKNRTEVGFLVEVPAGKKVSLSFRYFSPASLDFSQPGVYSLFWRKQAGTIKDPVSVNINAPFLTRGGEGSYNTTLERDFSTRLIW